MENELKGELKAIGHAETNLTDLALRFGPKILTAVLILALGFMVARWVGAAAERSFARAQLEPPLRLLLVRLVRVLVLLLFVIMALQNLGVELLPLIAGLGVAGAGIALATQGVLSNVVAGLTIIFTKPYRIGESIAIVGVDGVVESITLFSTVLRHSDRSKVVIPNRKIVGEILHNYGMTRQSELEVRVAYGADLRAALATIESLVRGHPKVLADPAPQIQVAALSGSAVRITAKPWTSVADFGSVEGELYIQVMDALHRQGMDIPLPASEVRLVGRDGMKVA
jgi:small conductance mechanosensitive channel